MSTPQFIHSQFYDCFPCESAQRSSASPYWPQVRMQRYYSSHKLDEVLRIEILNPWPDYILRHVRIAFLTALPNAYLGNGRHVVTFHPAHAVDFGDIAFIAPHLHKTRGVMRDIVLVETQALAEGRQFFAGVCFDAFAVKKHNTVHYGYVLYRSGLLVPAPYSNEPKAVQVA